MANIACIVLNFGSTSDTLEALESLTHLKGREELEVIVVDNGSTAQTRTELEGFEKFPISVLASSENLGFSGGVNRGIAKALEGNAQFIWLLNNDALVDEHCLEHLLVAAQETGSKLLGSLVYYHPEREKVWFGGGRVHWPWCIAECIGKGRGPESLPSTDKPFEVPFISGCSMFIHRSLIEDIGMLYDDFFVYGEDLDFCIRAAKNGYKMYLQPRSIVWHKLSQATGGEFNMLKEYYNTRNGLLLISMYVRSIPLRTIAYLGRSVWDLYRITKSLVKTGKSPLNALAVYGKALSDFRDGRFGKFQGNAQSLFEST